MAEKIHYGRWIGLTWESQLVRQSPGTIVKGYVDRSDFDIVTDIRNGRAVLGDMCAMR